MVDSKIIRNIEKSVDDVFKKNDLLFRPHEETLISIFYEYEIAGLADSFLDPGPAVGKDFSDRLKYALMYSLRWLFTTKARRRKVKDLSKSAIKLLSLAMDYAEVVPGFTMYWHGYYSCEVISDNELKFTIPEPFLYYEGVSKVIDIINVGDQFDNTIRATQEFFRRKPDLKFEGITERGVLNLDSDNHAFGTFYRLGLEIVSGFCRMPVDWKYRAYDLSTLLKIWAALVGVSLMTKFIYFKRIEPRLLLPFLSFDIGVWAGFISRVTGLEEPIVNDFIALNTYRKGANYADPALQPFIPFGRSELILSPELINTSNLLRNFIVLLNKIDNNGYNATTAVLEKEQIGKVDRILAAKWRTFTNRDFKGQDIDIFVVDEEEDQLLVLELKWTYEAAEPHDIINKIKSVEEKGFGQVKTRIALVEDKLHDFAKKFRINFNDIRKVTVVGCLVISGFSGSGILHKENIPVIEESLFLSAAQSFDLLSDFVRFLVNKEFLPIDGKEIEKGFNKIKIGDFYISVPGYKVNAPEYQKRLSLLFY